MCLGVAFYDFVWGTSLGTECKGSGGKEEEREVLILKMFLAHNVPSEFPELSKENSHLQPMVLIIRKEIIFTMWADS